MGIVQAAYSHAPRPPRRASAGRDPGRPHGHRAGQRLARTSRVWSRSRREGGCARAQPEPLGALVPRSRDARWRCCGAVDRARLERGRPGLPERPVAVGGGGDRHQLRLHRRARDRLGTSSSTRRFRIRRGSGRSSRPSASACWRTRSCPGRIGELARVGVLTRHMNRRRGVLGDARRDGRRASRLRPRAHRRCSCSTSSSPRRSRPGPTRSSSPSSPVGTTLFVLAVAQRPLRGARQTRRRRRRTRGRCTMAREGLAVMHRPSPAVGAIFFQCARLGLPAVRGVHGDARVRHPRGRCRRPGSCWW